jgi:L-asparaginase II
LTSAAGRGAPLVEVVRSGFAESVHRGSAVLLAADGSVLGAVGDPWAAVFPRSCSKPAQAAGMVAAGLDLPDALLALAAASHSGAPEHLAGVAEILAGAGLGPERLQTPADLPLGVAEREAWLRSGSAPEARAMNCSGKHAAMLATCVARGWPLDSYREAGHPLQQALRAEAERLAGEAVSATGVDGCGAPVWGMSLVGLARTYRACVLAEPDQPPRRVADAMRSFPELVGGEGRDATRLMRAFPGLVAKDGADGVYAVALADGRAAAVKIDDGAERARTPVVLAALAALGAPAAADLADLAEPPVLGGGRPVGSVRALPGLFG